MKLEKNKSATFDMKSVLDKLNKTDFDGHTNFALFTSEQKLSWLSNAAQFWFLANKNACPEPAQGSQTSLRLTMTAKKTIEENDEWHSWYALSPQKRWLETQKLWDFYQKAGGSLDPEPDYQSPFRTAWLPGAFSTHGRPGMRIIRRV